MKLGIVGAETVINLVNRMPWRSDLSLYRTDGNFWIGANGKFGVVVQAKWIGPMRTTFPNGDEDHLPNGSERVVQMVLDAMNKWTGSLPNNGSMRAPVVHPCHANGQRNTRTMDGGRGACPPQMDMGRVRACPQWQRVVSRQWDKWTACRHRHPCPPHPRNTSGISNRCKRLWATQMESDGLTLPSTPKRRLGSVLCGLRARWSTPAPCRCPHWPPVAPCAPVRAPVHRRGPPLPLPHRGHHRGQYVRRPPPQGQGPVHRQRGPPPVGSGPLCGC